MDIKMNNRLNYPYFLLFLCGFGDRFMRHIVFFFLFPFKQLVNENFSFFPHFVISLFGQGSATFYQRHYFGV